MARYKVILAYDGTDFSGMQRQAKSRSVQSVVESALRLLGWVGKSILVAGRTDAGVHASGQVIAFDLEWAHTGSALLKAMNAGLPAQIAAKEVSQVDGVFHPRFDAKSRTYEYRLLCCPVRDPLRERYAWRVWPAPRISRLRAGVKLLIGEHDFAAFGSPPMKGGNTVRKVLKASWRQDAEDELVFTVKANAFLFRMVRRMVGLQVKVGQGLAELTALRVALNSSERMRELAPAQGLTLIEVEY